MTKIILISLVFLPIGLFGQETPPPPVVTVQTSKAEKEVVFVEDIIDFPDKEAGFKGGTKEMQKFINENVKYPQDAINSNIEGRVYLSFVVEKNGEITNIIVERGTHLSLDREAKRLISIMPKWKPGKMQGKKVKTRCRLPINFTLN